MFHATWHLCTQYTHQSGDLPSGPQRVPCSPSDVRVPYMWSGEEGVTFRATPMAISLFRANVFAINPFRLRRSHDSIHISLGTRTCFPSPIWPTPGRRETLAVQPRSDQPNE